MRNYPGLTERETDEIVARGPRCGKCEACRLIEDSKALYAPSPPFSHANDATVSGWNRLLFDNPCEVGQ